MIFLCQRPTLYGFLSLHHNAHVLRIINDISFCFPNHQMLCLLLSIQHNSLLLKQLQVILAPIIILTLFTCINMLTFTFKWPCEWYVIVSTFHLIFIRLHLYGLCTFIDWDCHKIWELTSLSKLPYMKIGSCHHLCTMTMVVLCMT